MVCSPASATLADEPTVGAWAPIGRAAAATASAASALGGPLGVDRTKHARGVGDALEPLGPGGPIEAPGGAGIDEEELVGHGYIMQRGCDTHGLQSETRPG